MSQGIAYNSTCTAMLYCHSACTSRLLRGRVSDFPTGRSEFDPRPVQVRKNFSSPVIRTHTLCMQTNCNYTNTNVILVSVTFLFVVVVVLIVRFRKNNYRIIIDYYPILFNINLPYEFM